MASKVRSIGVIIGSTRQPRIGPQIVDFVVDTILTSRDESDILPELKIIDLADWKLPFFDEPGIPKTITNHNNYTHEHTRLWSQEVQRHDAFIFVTPQYNWGYPAVLKNAIDFLFNEWVGKPAMIVTYGGHGGSRCNAQLREVLNGVDMVVAKQSVELTFPSRMVLGKAAKGEALDLDGKTDSSFWAADQKTVMRAYCELVELLDKPST